MKILVVDDEEAMLEVLQLRLEGWGHQVWTASDGKSAVRIFEDNGYDLVMSDVLMPGMTGLELLHRLQSDNPDLPVVLITAHGSIELAVAAMKEGAHDFITKPLDYDKLQDILDSVEKRLEVSAALGLQFEGKAQDLAGFGPLIGDSERMREVYRLIQAAAPSDVAVLITGESGTGKELVARCIHQLSARSRHTFFAVNASAIPTELMESEIFGHEKGAFTGAVERRPGCFELAHQGTLFLDEIGEMPPELQPKLLRVLEDGTVRRLGSSAEFQFDVRVVSATNRTPQEGIRQGKLREDLFYRLNVLSIDLPPLRERRGDIAMLAEHFLQQFARKHQSRSREISAEALKVLRDYPWPGNVRELRNVVERVVVLAGAERIESSHLPPELLSLQPAAESEDLQFPAGITAREAEKQLILSTLERVGHNKAEAARQLGLDVKTIRNKLKAYGLS